MTTIALTASQLLRTELDLVVEFIQDPNVCVRFVADRDVDTCDAYIAVAVLRREGLRCSWAVDGRRRAWLYVEQESA